MDNRYPKKTSSLEDKNPYNRRDEKITEKAFKSVDKSVKPVAKDTNKTRRKETRSRIVGETVASVGPRSSLKKALSRVKCSKC